MSPRPAQCLLFRVGPVHLCTDAAAVLAVQREPRPRSVLGRPVFEHAGQIWPLTELSEARTGPVLAMTGTGGNAGYRVDEVMQLVTPQAGAWRETPALLPRGVFAGVLERDGRLWLLCHPGALSGATGPALLAAAGDWQAAERVASESRPLTGGTRGPAAAVSVPAPPHATPAVPSPVASTAATDRAEAPTAVSPPSGSVLATRPAVAPRASARAEPTPVREWRRAASAERPGTGVSAPRPPPTRREPASPLATAGAVVPPAPARGLAPPDPRLVDAPPAPTAAGGGLGLLVGVLGLLVLLGGWGYWELLAPPDWSVSDPSLARAWGVSPPAARAPGPALGPPVPVAAPAEPERNVQLTPGGSGGAAPQAPVPAPSPVASSSPLATDREAPVGRPEGPSLERQGRTLTLVLTEPGGAGVPDEAPGATGTQAIGGGGVSPPQGEVHASAIRAPTAPVELRRFVHLVVPGDTLWHIAERYLEDPFRYPELARLSRIRDPDLIYPGEEVVIVVRGSVRLANPPR